MKTIATLADLATPGFGMDFLTDVDTLQGYNRSYVREEDAFGTMERVYKPHLWWTHTSNQFRLHPVVKTIITQYNVRPMDWHLLMLEWPHVSVDDDSQLAYTRTEEAGVDFMDNGSKRQTKTSIGKYVARHWPHVPDHIRRDWVGTFSPSNFEIWEGVENIIAGIELGPQSCMKSSYGTVPFTRYDNEKLLAYRAGKIPKEEVNWDSHPYIVYQPRFGWAMAVRLDKGKPDIVMGRCLVQLQDKVFVRSYKRGDTDSDYSHTDEKLEHWLKGQGFSKTHGWDGYKMAIFDHPEGGWMGPYLDGCTQTVKNCGEYLQIDEDGSYQSDDTDGQLQGSAEEDEEESIGDCDHCGSSVPEGDCDHIWVGRDEDTLICTDCTHHYTHVTGEGEDGDTQYYVRNRYAVSVGHTEYDKHNLPSYIYELDGGEYAHEDNCVCCVDGEYRLTTDCVCDEDGDWHEEDSEDIVKIGCLYYKKDSDDIVCPEDDPDEWHEKEKCWESVSGKWFTEEQSQIEIELEGTYAASELQEMIDNA